jgi:hypothetical protein
MEFPSFKPSLQRKPKVQSSNLAAYKPTLKIEPKPAAQRAAIPAPNPAAVPAAKPASNPAAAPTAKPAAKHVSIPAAQPGQPATFDIPPEVFLYFDQHYTKF